VANIDGLPVPLRLADNVVYERHYRSVFQFHYDRNAQRNQLHADVNPFLARGSSTRQRQIAILEMWWRNLRMRA
jgi:hypothetical protein